MNENTLHPAWMDDELVKDIAPEKLDFLGKMFSEGHGKNQKEMMAFLMPMMKKAKQEKLTFTPQEMNAAIAAIKKHSSEDELQKIDQILNKAKGGGK
ncbi:MAG: hypothetical protein E7291_01795 [Lachnospiraceae bacterium]|nr:hypothetical protein [Lachnospiraceae bacterium]